jgi:hypothetical protein
MNKQAEKSTMYGVNVCITIKVNRFDVDRAEKHLKDAWMNAPFSALFVSLENDLDADPKEGDINNEY